MNEENIWDGNTINLNVEGPYEIFAQDAQKLLSSMKTKKASGPIVNPSDLLKQCGDENVWWLMKLSSGLLEEEIRKVLSPKLGS